MNYTLEAIKAVSIVVIILNFIPVLIWFERKGSAYIQDRRGPNRASIFGIRLGGMLHNIADVIKLITKEDIVPTKANKFLFHLAPLIAIFVASVTIGVIPFAESIDFNGYVINFQAANLNVGLLYILAIGSLGVYGVLLAGWSSHSTYALLGGIRAAAQMVSYELSMGLALVSLLLVAGSVNINEIVSAQSGGVLYWFAARQPLAFIIFLVALFAETNRNPFDLAEGESELVAGFHTEYSSMKFALFFMAEYAHIAVAAALLTTLFFGGWNVPGLDWDLVRQNPIETLRSSLIPFGFGSLLLGAFLCSRFRKGKYGDARDYEVLVFGIPGAAAGLIALTLYAFFPASWSIVYPWDGVVVAAMQIGVTFLKMIFFCWLFIHVRWTLPRFRYDQLMKLGWRIMLPLALANIVVTAGFVALG